jgi:hypothetical protein
VVELIIKALTGSNFGNPFSIKVADIGYNNDIADINITMHFSHIGTCDGFD